MRRSGFTLVEALIGLVVASVVALLVYGTLRSAIDTDVRIAEDAAAQRSEAAWRALITETVRNLRGSVDYGAPTLLLVDGTDADGRPADRLVLVTAAGHPPLTHEDDWRVAIYPDGGGLTFAASPVHDLLRTRSLGAPDGILTMSVEALAGGGLGWQASWPAGAAVPFALRFTFWDAEGPRPDPLVLSLPVAAGP